MLRTYKFKLDAEKFKITPEGYLDCVGVCARTGIQTYIDNGKPFKEFRSEQEVFNHDSLKTHKLVPVTIQHPESVVNSENFKNFTIGVTGTSPRKDGDHLLNDFRIMDKEAVDWIIERRDRSESVEISMGYNSEIDPTPGEFRGETYDALQKNIRINHAALCDQGQARAGRSAKLRLDNDPNSKELALFLLDRKATDSLKAIVVSKKIANTVEDARKIAREFGATGKVEVTESDFSFGQTDPGNFKTDSLTIKTFNIPGKEGVSLVFGTLKERKDSMKTFKKDGVNIDNFHMDQVELEYHDDSESVVSLIGRKLDEAIGVIKDMIASRDTAKKDSEEAIATEKKETEGMKARADQFETDNKKLKEEVNELTNLDSDRMQGLIKDKSKIKAVAAYFKVDTKDKTDKQIKLDVIKTVSSDFDTEKEENQGDGYVNGRFDLIFDTAREDIEKMETSKDSLSSFLKNAEEKKKGTQKTDIRAKFMADSQNAWKTGTSFPVEQ